MMSGYFNMIKYERCDPDKHEEDFKNIFTNMGKITTTILTSDSNISIYIIEKIKVMQNSLSKSSINLKEDNALSQPLNSSSCQTEKKQALTSYLIILALSIHALFEGLALGLQDNSNELFYMLLAIVLHKWVEALSIGINLSQSDIDRHSLLYYISLFSAMTPLGILIGMVFSGGSAIFEAVFLSISAGKYCHVLCLGSFIYISASEIVADEFAVSQFKIEKFYGFLLGAGIIVILTIFEHSG